MKFSDWGLRVPPEYGGANLIGKVDADGNVPGYDRAAAIAQSWREADERRTRGECVACFGELDGEKFEHRKGVVCRKCHEHSNQRKR